MKRLLYSLVFLSGMTSLAIEMTASRLVGTYFGTSNLVWACIIGLILVFLAAGYLIGGLLADRSPQFSTFLKIYIWASVSIIIVPAISGPILRSAANAFDELNIGILAATFISVLILLCVPMTLLGTTSPFAIRLAIQELNEAGGISGRVYAISTLGSFIGTFLPVLVLIPLINTYRTFVFFGALILIPSLISLGAVAGWKKTLPYLWTPILLVIVLYFGLPSKEKDTHGMIYETESAYNYIQVLEDNGYRFLRLNEGQGIHSVYHPSIMDYRGPWEQVLVAPFFNEPPHPIDRVRKVAIVGLAAGTTARQITTVFGSIPIDGIEIDPKIVKAGQTYFDMNEPNLNIIIQDGRWALRTSQSKYSIISVDAYRPPYIPFHLTTTEFFEIAREHLELDGSLIINVGRAPNDRRLIDALFATIRTVFPSAYVVDIPETFNSVIFATATKSRASNLTANLEYLSEIPGTPKLLIDSINLAATNIQPAPQGGLVFTDDSAPIEWITNSMILGYLVSGDLEDLQ